jgi:hypothetical protein
MLPQYRTKQFWQLDSIPECACALLGESCLGHRRCAGAVAVLLLVCRNAGFLSNVEAELTQQLLRIGSHASMVVFGGNNEVEQSLEWYKETVGNVAMYAADYSALFEATIAPLVQKVGVCRRVWGKGGWVVVSSKRSLTRCQ